MKTYEGFATMTHDEFSKLKKKGKVYFTDNRKYAKGEVAYFNGEPYMSMKNDNNLIVSKAAIPDWKKIIFDC